MFTVLKFRITFFYYCLQHYEITVLLTHEMQMLSSYRNQSIDLDSKSIDWFLYEGNTGI